MIRSVCLAALILLLLPADSNTADHDSPVGLWRTVDDRTGEVRSIIRIWLEQGKLFGRVEKSFPRPGEPKNPLCEKCPPPFRGRPVIGLTFMWDFELSGKKWINGRVLDPEEGKIYNCELTLAPDGQSLKVYGYIRLLVRIGRSQTWLRADPDSLE